MDQPLRGRFGFGAGIGLAAVVIAVVFVAGADFDGQEPAKAEVPGAPGNRAGPNQELSGFSDRAIYEALQRRAAFQTKVVKDADPTFPVNLAHALTHLDGELPNRFEAMSDVEITEVVRRDPLTWYDSSTLIGELKARAKRVIGDDDRVDLLTLERRVEFYKKGGVVDAKIERLQRQLDHARSVCLVIQNRHMDETRLGVYLLKTRTFNVCAKENFSKQPMCGHCTGFVVGDDLIATAHHCLEDENVEDLRFVFGYRLPPSGEFPSAGGQRVVAIKNDDIYRGVKVVCEDAEADWAVVRVDRRIAGRPPLPVRGARVADREQVYTIGYPSGLPEKVADNAKVLNNSDPGNFTADLDTFEGNSGSPVFSELDHQVIGILVAGWSDYKLVLNNDIPCYEVVCLLDPAKVQLMSSVNVGDIPTAGKSLMIVAAVKNVLHFRIFDTAGRRVINTDETKLTSQARLIEKLRMQLEGLWPSHELAESEKVRVIDAVKLIVDYPKGEVVTRAEKLVKALGAARANHAGEGR